MKLRLLPVLLTFFFSAAIFFGGWFIYQQMAVKQPIDDIIEGIVGVESGEVVIDQDRVEVHLELKDNADLRAVYTEINRKSRAVTGNREVQIDIVQASSDHLEELWSKALFDIAESMENHQYGSIPVHLNKLASEHEELDVQAEMDENHVYIRLTDGASSKFIVLPRTPAQMGVWTNESI